MIFRVSILVVASVITLSVSHKRKHFIKHLSEKDHGHGCQQIGEDEKKVEDDFTEEAEGVERKTKRNLMRKTDCDNIKACRSFDRLVYMQDFQRLEKELKQRKMAIEGKMLQLYNLKEQQSQISHLQKHLKDKMEEIQTLTITINSLKSETKCLQEEIRQGTMTEKQLRMAKQVIEEMQTENETKAIEVKMPLMMLEKQVSEFQRNDSSSMDAIVKKRLKAGQDMELLVLEMKRKKRELEFEKRALAMKLASAHAKIAALAESKLNHAKVEEEANRLRHANEERSGEVEKLQKNRFNMVEELVYQRWLNACMRFESKNYKLQLRTLECDHPRPKSHKRPCKQPVLDPIFDNSSRTSRSSESEEIDSSTVWSSSSSQRSIEKISSVIHRIKSWGRTRIRRRSKDLSHDNKSSTQTSLIRRFSDSMVPSKPSILIRKHKEDLEKHNQVRRVSFKDETKTVPKKDHPQSIVTMMMRGQSKITLERLGERVIGCEANGFFEERKLQESSID